MASNLALSGLASGVDTSTIVEQLMAIDRQGTTRITYRQSGVTGMQNSLKAIAGENAAGEGAAGAAARPRPRRVRGAPRGRPRPLGPPRARKIGPAWPEPAPRSPTSGARPT